MADISGAARLTNGAPNEVVLSADGRTVYVAGADGTISAFATATGALTATWKVGTRLGGMDLTADGRYLVVTEREPVGSSLDQNGTRSYTVTVHRVDTTTGAVVNYDFRPTGLDFTFYDAAVLADGKVLLSQSFSGSGWVNLKLLDLATGAYTTTALSVRQDSVLSLDTGRTRVLVGEANISNAQLDIVELRGDGTLATIGTNGSSGFNDGIQAFSGNANFVADFVYGTGLLLFDGQLKFVENLTNRFPQWRTDEVGGLAFDAKGEFLYVLDQSAEEVVKLSTATWQRVGGYALDPGYASDRGGRFGNDLLVTADGYLVVSGGAGVQLVAPDAFRATGVQLVGTAGDDLLVGSGDGDQLVGGAGADILRGEGGDDVLASADGFIGSRLGDDLGREVDQLFGGDGADLLAIGYGDGADGGGGNDMLRLSLAGATGGVVLDTATFSGGRTTILAGGTIRNVESLQYLRGSAFGDTVTLAVQAASVTVDGAGGDDVVTATGGPLVFNGGAGDDRLIAGSGTESFDGGDGIDTVNYRAATTGVFVRLGATAGAAGTGPGGDRLLSVEAVIGSRFNDSIDGGVGAERLIGAGGNDILRGNGGNDLLEGEDGNDDLMGGAGDDALYGGEGEDNLRGDDGRDLLDGGAGNDRLSRGGVGSAVMRGGDGDDQYLGVSGGDQVIEAIGGGRDSVGASGDFTLAAGQEVERLFLVNGPGNLSGNEFANDIFGNEFANRLAGGAGDDRLYGNNGDDVLAGDAGDDLIDGGVGFDTATFGATLAGSLVGFGADGAVIVDGPDGRDTLLGVERLQFVDGTLAPAAAAGVGRVYAAWGGRDASGSELAYWTGEIAGGRTTLAGVKAAILADPLGQANTAAVVSGLYAEYLGRAPGADELSYWDGQVRGGTDFAQVRGVIVADPSGQAFAAARIVALYDDYLGRAPGAGEVTFWTNEVRIGTDFAGVRAALVDDPSGRAHAAGAIDTVYRDYGGRAASAEEVAFWTGQFRAGSTVADVRDAVLDDGLGRGFTAAALSGLYLELFGRDAAAGEQAVWHDFFHDGFTLDAARSALSFDGGSAGRVRLGVGTADADVFAFAAGDRHLAIGGFDPFLDRIDLRGLGLASGTDPLDAAHAREIATLDGGTDVLITLDGTHDILIRGVALGQLGAADFLL
ncbi:MAG TPA: calcium-binding protein [Sphingomonas sp.]|jgi:Ca2+-binding RTX toxin-like protein|uniref:calcium-binding protein n=1 Tax=Sphingomonas sp. TaxID=28214 RepID=UPI002ED900BB